MATMMKAGRLGLLALVGVAGAAVSGVARGQTWNKDDGDFKWGTGGNWNPVGVPNAVDASVKFQSIISQARTIDVNGSFSLKELVFKTDDDKKAYTLAGGGDLKFINNTQNRILIDDGNKANHTIKTNIKIDNKDLILENASANALPYEQRTIIAGGIFELNNTARALRFRGTGYFDLQTESNFLTGGTFIEQGMLTVKSDKSLGNGNKDVSIISGKLLVPDKFSTTRKIAIAKATGQGFAQIGTMDGGTSEFKGVISGTGGLTIFGTGVTTLKADNTFNGDVFLLGKLSISKASNLGVGAEIDIGDKDASLIVTDNVTTTRDVIIYDAGNIDVADKKTFTCKKLDGNVNNNLEVLKKDGKGTLAVTGKGTKGFKKLELNEGKVDVAGSITTADGIVAMVNGKEKEISGGGAIAGKLVTADGVKMRPKKGNKESIEWHLDQTGDLEMGGTTNFEMGISMAGGTGGQSTGWGQWNLTGNLLLSATPADPVIVSLNSLELGSDEQGGYVLDFDPAQAYSWKFIAVSGGFISGFDSSAYVVDASNFWNLTYGGVFSVSQLSDGLYVNFTPSPTPGAVSVLGLAGVFGARRRRR